MCSLPKPQHQCSGNVASGSHICVESVDLSSLALEDLKSTCAFTQVKNHINASSVEKLSLSLGSSLHMYASTQEKDHISVKSVGHLFPCLDLSSST